MELMLLSLFDWDINRPTAATFCLYFVKYGVSENDYRQNWTRFNNLSGMMDSVRVATMNLLENSLFGRHNYL